MLRRLLERLEQGVERLHREHVDLVDDVDLVAPARRGKRHAVDDLLADVVHARARRGVQLVDVGVLACGDGLALLAGAVGLGRGPVLAQKGLSQHTGRGRLARATRAAEEVGVRHATLGQGVVQRGHDVLLAHHVGEDLRSILAVQRLHGRLLRRVRQAAPPRTRAAAPPRLTHAPSVAHGPPAEAPARVGHTKAAREDGRTNPRARSPPHHAAPARRPGPRLHAPTAVPPRRPRNALAQKSPAGQPIVRVCIPRRLPQHPKLPPSGADGHPLAAKPQAAVRSGSLHRHPRYANSQKWLRPRPAHEKGPSRQEEQSLRTRQAPNRTPNTRKRGYLSSPSTSTSSMLKLSALPASSWLASSTTSPFSADLIVTGTGRLPMKT